MSRIILGETTEYELDNFLNDIQKYCDLVGEILGKGPLDFSCSSCNGDVHDLINVLNTNTNISEGETK